MTENELPPLPQPDEHGRFPAVEYARISLARHIIRDRLAAGLTQQELAKLAGVRQQTIARLESGKHVQPPRLIDRIDRALKDAESKRHGTN